MNHSLPPSAFQSSINNASTYLNTPIGTGMVGNDHIVSINEAKSLYFAHYNGLEVTLR